VHLFIGHFDTQNMIVGYQRHTPRTLPLAGTDEKKNSQVVRPGRVVDFAFEQRINLNAL
jgi:hypothetical protein